MADSKLYAGHAVRRLRRASNLTQQAMAEQLEVSPSYLNLIERNQRPITAALLLRLAEQFEFDPRQLRVDEPGGGADALRQRLAHPMFDDLGLGRAEISDWLAASPDTAEAFARVFDRMNSPTTSPEDEEDATELVRREVERWHNHFADLDRNAEELADRLHQSNADPGSAIVERLRAKHQIAVNVLPVELMSGRLHQLDNHARQFQMSEILDTASRNFALALQLAFLEHSEEIEGLVRGAGFTNPAAQRLFRRHLNSYFAAAVIMPYVRFLQACETTGYDMNILQRRFGASYEQVAHRLTTLHRVGARGLPFFMIRVDRAGQVSKRFAGASGSPLAENYKLCPLRALHLAFEVRGQMVVQVVELEDGARWFTFARTVRPHWNATPMGAANAIFSIGLGLNVDLAANLALARGVDLAPSGSVKIGLGCRSCLRVDCAQRAHPPRGRAINLNERERGMTPFNFARD